MFSNLKRLGVLAAAGVCLLTTLFVVRTSAQKLNEGVQEYYTHSRSFQATIAGAGVVADTSIGISLQSNPWPEYCVSRCVKRSSIRVSLGCSGTARRYISPGLQFATNVTLEVIVKDQDDYPIYSYCDTLELELKSDSLSDVPLTIWRQDITNYTLNACGIEQSDFIDSVQVRILTLDSSGVASIDTNLWVDLEYEEIVTVSGLMAGTTLEECSNTEYIMVEPTSVSANNPVTLHWQVECPNDSFPNYQVQIQRLYNYDTVNQHTDSTISTAIDWTNALTVETYGPKTELTLTLTEGTGFYAWRVRPIGDEYPYSVGHEGNWGCWSTAPPHGTTNLDIVAGMGTVEIAGHEEWEPSVFFYKQFDDTLNWNHVRTWVEGLDGQPGMGEVLTYANGLGRPRQMQVFDHNNNKILATVTAYDFEGRGLLNSMSAPISTGYFGYRQNVFDGTGGYPYRAADFDADPQVVSAATGTINDYWSEENDDETIPSAEGFAFSRSLLTSDPLSEGSEDSGPGGVLKIGEGHTTVYMQAEPAYEEIVSIFGDEAPDVAKVIKRVTIDPNGVRSVAYVDELGRTIATCLEKQAQPSVSLLDLDDNDTANTMVTKAVLKKGARIGKDAVFNTKTFLLSDTTVVRLDYSLDKQAVEVACAALCFSCDYSIALRIVNDSTGEVEWEEETVYQPLSCSPMPDSLVLETDSVSLLPGSYRMERLVRTALPDTTVNVGDTLIRTMRDKHADSARTLFVASGDALLEDLFGEDQLSRYYSDETDNGKLQDTMLANYLTYFAELDSTKSVAVGECCIVTLPESPCATGCGDSVYQWEDAIFSRWGDTFGTTLADYFWVNGDTTQPIFDYASPEGSFDSLVTSMIVEGGYSCSDLWNCFGGLLEQLDRLAYDSTGFKRPSFDFYDVFLSCAGRKLCDFSTTPTGPTGYRTRGWKYYYADSTNASTDSLLGFFSYDPNDTTGAWACGVGESDSLANVNHLRIYRALNRYDAETVSEWADSLGVETNPLSELCEELTPECIAEYVKRQVDTCKSVCQARADQFRDSVIAAWHRDGYWVEGDVFDYRSEPKLDDTVGLDVISCLTYGLLEHCEAQCNLTIEVDTTYEVVGMDTVMHVYVTEVGTPQEIAAMNQVRFNGGFSLDISDSCTNPADTNIVPKIPASIRLADVLNQHLEVMRDTMQTDYVLWDYSAIWAELIFDMPYTSGICPVDTNKVAHVYKYGTSEFEGHIIHGDSGAPDQCYLTYEYAIPQMKIYNEQNPHPLVAWLNDYLNYHWGLQQSGSILTTSGVIDSCSTSHRDNSEYYSNYRIAYDSVDDDPLKWQWLMCEYETIVGPDTILDSVYCDAMLPCINGIGLLELGAVFNPVMSRSVSLFRLNRNDADLSTAGVLSFMLSGTFFTTGLIGDTCNYGNIDSLKLYLTVGGVNKVYAFETSASKHELLSLLGQDYTDVVGRFTMNQYGQLVFENLMEDEYTSHTFGGINFNCSNCPPKIDTVCWAICDSVSCGSMCFRWLPIPDSLQSFIPKKRSCAMDAIHTIMTSIRQQLNECERNVVDSVVISYNRTCGNPDSLSDAFKASYGLEFYHYTLYYYDRAGRLVQTVPPKGVHPLRDEEISRDNHPAHTFRTTYRYNTLGQLTEQSTPDGGITKFWYNAVGQLRLSQNARQLPDNKVSYTNYDALGRVVEVGQTTESSPATAASGTTTAAGEYRVITKYTDFFDLPEPWEARDQRFLDNRVSRVQSDRDGDTTTMDDLVTTYYSYDPHGNVEWLVNELPGLTGTENRQGVLTEYEYDIISGKVIRVAYQPGRYDEFRHHYRYDHDSRLVSVSTSRDSIIWDEDARYEYYDHGPLRRMELGQDSVQGIDYTYTIHGWLKAINTPSLDSSLDVGQDGLVGGDHAAFPRDAFGMILGYHDGDFVRGESQFETGADWTYPGVNLYNGNISSWTWDSRDITGAPQGALAASYRYDVLNRIKRDTIHARGTTNWEASTGAFETSYSYDPNGNILTLTRNNSAGTPFDDLAYTYLAGTNKLTHIDDTESSGIHASDLDDQNADNYNYDATGNMTQDVLEDIDLIIWTPTNKIDSINKGDTLGIKYLYNSSGHRVVERVWEGIGASTFAKAMWHARDAQGNLLVTYDALHDTSEPTIRSTAIYGSEHLGTVTTPVTSAVYIDSAISIRNVKNTLFELKDHLGNVRVVITDLIIDTTGACTPTISTMTDYYPYGMKIDARTSVQNYPLGYNSHRISEDISHSGNVYHAQFWEYDSRAARRWNRDPRPTVGQSPYSVLLNSPVVSCDPFGDTIKISVESTFLFIFKKTETFIYTDGQLTTQSGDLVSVDHESFANITAQALDEIRGVSAGSPSGIGGELISELQSSSNVFNIVLGTKSQIVSDNTAAAAYKFLTDNPDIIGKIYNGIDFKDRPVAGGSGATIYWNPTGALLPTTDGDLRNGTSDLAHELAHGLSYNRGLFDPRTYMSPRDGIPTLHNYEEANASYLENVIRRELGLPYRTRYGGNSEWTLPGPFGTGYIRRDYFELLDRDSRPIKPAGGAP